ncbi:hypothetical protein DM2_2323 [Halorubrum sp. DM2]|nr:hypothetical protein DM2_2323 [Halorubrum sp. DM2]
MDASINLYETIHEPRESKIGLGRHQLVSTDSHIHSHEMVYDEGKLQFFFKPETRVDANQVERQIRKNYPDAQITEANKQFPTIDRGDHIAMAKMRLKRPFYYPIKCKIAEEDFEMDPYGDITSDMVVEEDQTSSGERVLAEDCRVMVQTVFEPARDVWTKQRPYGINVTEAAAKIKEGELVGNMAKGYEVRDPGSKRTRTAKIIDKLHGAKGYYFTVRVLAISPHKEIAERRCNTVASDFEKYYNSFTEQGLTPVSIEPEEVPNHLEQMAERTHSISWTDRLKVGPAGGAPLQTVSALGSIAHIPNESINTPVVDWAKQQTGPGIPAESRQSDDVERAVGEDGSEGPEKSTFGGHKTGPPTSADPSPVSEPAAEAGGVPERNTPDNHTGESEPEGADGNADTPPSHDERDSGILDPDPLAADNGEREDEEDEDDQNPLGNNRRSGD